jgi:hypothetical protein
MPPRWRRSGQSFKSQSSFNKFIQQVHSTRRTEMRNRWIPKLVLLLGLGLAACQPVEAMPAVQSNGAADAANPVQCTLATLKGRYLFAGAGTILPPNSGVTEPTPGTHAGFHIFNGDGTGEDFLTVRINGKTVVDKFEVPIKYTVNADCTGGYAPQIKDGPTFELFIAPSGEQFSLISVTPGDYGVEIDPRVSPK